ncbi:hypothetical protein BBJ28_00008582 [Nothophytophthora sp. Chile5]|nr:hypothetical protein BBJ28_00008582 [Nothophytophthora sp. Chile5]
MKGECEDLKKEVDESTRDLWRTRDAKKEEARKNMLLYIDAQKGKRHFERPAESVEGGAADPTPPVPSVNNKLESPETVEMGASKGSDDIQPSPAATGASALRESQQERT